MLQQGHADVGGPINGGAELLRLSRTEVLTPTQARRLREEWLLLDDDMWAQPWYREVREHTRFLIDQLRKRSTEAT